jgi:hypothetical protein
MRQGLFKGIKKSCLLLATLLLICACSPKLNWRTIQSPEQKYTALFPGKPDKLDRLIAFEGQELHQTLEAVKIDDDVYSISTIELDSAQNNLVQKIVSQLQENLIERAKASGGTVISEDAVYQNSGHQKFPSKDYYISFGANGKVQQVMRVRWIVRSTNGEKNWIYQASVLHANKDVGDAKDFLSKEEYANFFNEFYPE